MFPQASLDMLYYPMTADVYYSTETQNDFGEVIKEWDKDRSIKCAVRKRSPNTRMPEYIQDGKFLEYDVDIIMRTPEDILVSSDYVPYRITNILISNIKDASGVLLWKEATEEPTIFEIHAIEPMLNMFNNLSGFRVNLIRSDKQDI